MKRQWEIKYNNSQVFTIDGEMSRLSSLNAFIKFTNDNNIKVDNIYSIRNVMVKGYKMANKEALEKAWDLVHNKYPENNEEIQLVRYAIKTAMELTKRIGELESKLIEQEKLIQKLKSDLISEGYIL